MSSQRQWIGLAWLSELNGRWAWHGLVLVAKEDEEEDGRSPIDVDDWMC
jgi:hypothetical protein